MDIRVTQMTQTPYVFISYSRKDIKEVMPYIRYLKERNTGKSTGKNSCVKFDIWYDIEGIYSGARWETVIAKKILFASAIIAFISNNSVYMSTYCPIEISYAIQNNIPIIYVNIDDCKLSEALAFLASSTNIEYVSKYKNQQVLFCNIYNSTLKIIDEMQNPAPVPESVQQSAEKIKRPKNKLITILYCILLATLVLIIAGGIFIYAAIDRDFPDIFADINNGALVEPCSSVNITTEDKGLLKNVSYKFGSQDNYTVIENGVHDKSTATIPIQFSAYAGTDTLTIIAEDLRGNKRTIEYTYTVSRNFDEKKPMLTIAPEKPEIRIGTEFFVCAEDDNSLRYISYQWDSKDTIIIYDNIENEKSAGISFYCPEEIGHHSLVLVSEDIYGNMTESVFRYTVTERDTSEPEIHRNTENAFYLPSENVSLIVTDESGIKSVLYKWDNDNEYTEISGFSGDTTIQVSCGELSKDDGTYILEAIAEDGFGNTSRERYEFIVYNDTAKPEVTPNIPTGNVQEGERITLSIADDKALKHIKIQWNDDEEKIVALDNKSSFGSVDAGVIGNTPGTYNLKVTVEDWAGNVTTQLYKYFRSSDSTAPVLTVSPKEGIVKAGTQVSLNLNDKTTLGKLAYKWNTDTEWTTLDSLVNKRTELNTFVGRVGSETGEYILEIKAEDSFGNAVLESYTFKVEPVSYADLLMEIWNDVSQERVLVGGIINIGVRGRRADTPRLKRISYKWEFNEKWIVSEDVSSQNIIEVEIYVPEVPNGIYTLSIIAEDENGNITYEDYQFEIEVSDTLSPEIDPGEEGFEIPRGNEIIFHSIDIGGLKKVAYKWDSDLEWNVLENSVYMERAVNFPVQTSHLPAGNYTIEIIAEDLAGNVSEKEFFYLIKE